MTKQEGIRILREIASSATGAVGDIASRMAAAFAGEPGAVMPTWAEIDALSDGEDGDDDE